MEEGSNNIGEVVIETDLVTWDPRSIEVVKKYGLSKMRYDALMSVHKDSERAERQYLLHIGTDISSEAFQKSPSPFDELKEARDIFAIIQTDWSVFDDRGSRVTRNRLLGSYPAPREWNG